MPRALIFLILLVLVIAGLLWFFGSRASEVPTRAIEIDVNAPANAQ
jgi:hypothetical protein